MCWSPVETTWVSVLVSCAMVALPITHMLPSSLLARWSENIWPGGLPLLDSSPIPSWFRAHTGHWRGQTSGLWDRPPQDTEDNFSVTDGCSESCSEQPNSWDRSLWAQEAGEGISRVWTLKLEYFCLLASQLHCFQLKIFWTFFYSICQNNS